jgi:hypothetical protein
MSTFLSQARARALRPVSSLPRPRLTVVSRIAPRAPRVPFVVLVLTVLIGGLVGLLLLNTGLQRGAYVATDLRATSADLLEQQQRLELDVAALREPQRVAAEAQALGMVQNDSPAFLELSTGHIVGTPVAGSRKNQVDVSHVGSGLPVEHAAKLPVVVAGSGTSLSSGPVTVKDPDAGHGKHHDAAQGRQQGGQRGGHQGGHQQGGDEQPGDGR